MPRSTACNFRLLVRFCALLTLCSEPSLADRDGADPIFAPCPASLNCVSSDASDEAHRVSALELAVPGTQAWQAVRAAVAALPRTRIVADTETYLHAECKSAWFGFVDDLELALRSELGIIAVRSASRVGYFDLGVNRRRIEGIRARLVAQGIVRK